MRRTLRTAMILAMMFLAAGCGTSEQHAAKEGHSGELPEVPEIAIDLGVRVALMPADEPGR